MVFGRKTVLANENGEKPEKKGEGKFQPGTLFPLLAPLIG
jgi:hypothetical protein